MTEDDLIAILDAKLGALGMAGEPGQDYRVPRLDILRFHQRPVRLHWLPVLGRGRSVTVLVRQPVDVGFSRAGYQTLLNRVARAVNDRYPPWRHRCWGSIGLSIVALTPEPIGPDEEAVLQDVLARAPRLLRIVPLSLIRLNLGQEAMAFTLTRGPDQLFPEPDALAEALTPHFRRYVAPFPSE